MPTAEARHAGVIGDDHGDGKGSETVEFGSVPEPGCRFVEVDLFRRHADVMGQLLRSSTRRRSGTEGASQWRVADSRARLCIGRSMRCLEFWLSGVRRISLSRMSR